MFWEGMFWISIVAGALLVITRVLIPSLRKGSKSGDESNEKPKGNFLTRGIFLPVVVIVVMVYSFSLKAFPDRVPALDLTNIHLFSRWSDDEKEGVQHLASSIEYYNNATTLAGQPKMTDEDWESVKALLIAAYDESGMVTDAVLAKVDDDMPAYYNDYFKPGIR